MEFLNNMGSFLIDVDVTQQIEQMVSYLDELKVKVDITADVTDILDPENNKNSELQRHDVVAILNLLKVGKETLRAIKDEKEQEMYLNAIISLIMLIDPQELKPVINKFIDVLYDESLKIQSKMRILTNVYYGLHPPDATRGMILTYLADLIGEHGRGLRIIPADVLKVKQLVNFWQLSASSAKKLYKCIFRAYVANNRNDLAAKILIQLVVMHSHDSTSEEAKLDIQKCIIFHLADPDSFLFDHLLCLQPIAAQQDSKLVQLLHLYVSGTYSDYLNFYSVTENKEFIDNLDGLNHEDIVRKMRILSFMSMASSYSSKQISFLDIQQQLELKEEEVEAFVIDVVRAGVVQMKIDQLGRKIDVTCAIHRTFTQEDWSRVLLPRLERWKQNIEKVRNDVHTLLPLQNI